ncbi:MAG: HAMP domain-containing histidine kinase [Candidatus Hydrogenedentes bacterium]|nr:HAMP domain-containing histidine kinase [Candidatus Hydrogenedentota bacterium]
MGCSVDTEVDLQASAMGEKLTKLYRYAQIGRCVSSVTHDVNNYLGAIMAYAELVGMDPALGSESNRMLSEIIGAVRKSSTLINNLTDVSRRERADVRIVDPANLMDRVLDLRRYDLKVAHVAVACEYEPQLHNFTADLPKLQQAMMYIISNAVEALDNQKNRRFEASVRMEGAVVAFTFHDTAPVIPESERARIFEPYYTTKGTDHMGLGLTIARATAEEHDGELAYDPARGFVMRIPTTNRYAEMS